MTEVASRQLRNQTRAVLDKVAHGEQVTITVDGRPVAVLSPVSARPRWLPADLLLSRLRSAQADPELTDELAELAPDTTDDLPL